MDWIAAHRKAILAAIGGVAILIVDEATVDHIIALADAVLIFLVPNDEQAVDRIYGRA